jgi:Xaa-Pro aminopeptidase
VEFSTFGPHLAQRFGAAQFFDMEPDLYMLRRRKDPDELARLRKAIAGTHRMYARAREMIRPGSSDLDMFNDLDLGPAFRGYFADNCRTFAVTKADENQQTAWSHVCRVLAHVERTVRPGKSCRELFQEACEILKEAPIGVFDHHLGHGIGLFPHEAPHLNPNWPNWDDVFQQGDVFTAEPGLYAPELRAGMRLENDYLVTASGVELLSDFPLEL